MEITVQQLIDKLSALDCKGEIIEVTETCKSFDGSIPSEFDVVVLFSPECKIIEINNLYIE